MKSGAISFFFAAGKYIYLKFYQTKLRIYIKGNEFNNEFYHVF